MTATQTKTLFQTGNDLSDSFMKVCYRRLKSDSFDVYEMIANPNVSIRHIARRGPSELIKEDPTNGNTYAAGITYDSFDVWVNLQDADSTTGRPGCSKCVGEDIRSFEEALIVAMKNV